MNYIFTVKRSYKVFKKKFLTCEKYILVKKSNMATGCWGVFRLAFKGLETIYAPSTFTAHKSKGKCTHNEKERKIM